MCVLYLYMCVLYSYMCVRYVYMCVYMYMCVYNYDCICTCAYPRRIRKRVTDDDAPSPMGPLLPASSFNMLSARAAPCNHHPLHTSLGNMYKDGF